MVESCGINPVQRVQGVLQDFLNARVQFAKQEGESYFPAIARELNASVLLHADFAQFIPSYWCISKIVSEISWNIYLTDPGEGGECIVYEKPWERADDIHIVGNTYGYDPSVVEGKPNAHIKANAGRLVFFNSRNFHEVAAAKRPRVSIGGHVGKTPEGEFLMWS